MHCPRRSLKISWVADGVRAIGKANTDNKNIGKAAAFCVNPVFCKAIPELQTGCVKGRDICKNVLEVDSWSRIYCNRARRNCKPGALAFWDLAQAYPSVSVQWLWLVLSALKCPAG
eukprot:6740008-Karenia_brevis.AAC.1